MSSTIGNLSNVYNFYMTSYAPKSSSPYDSHKKSELRRVYNSIVKMNKESPLFILDTSRSSQQFAIASCTQDTLKKQNRINHGISDPDTKQGLNNISCEGALRTVKGY